MQAILYLLHVWIVICIFGCLVRSSQACECGLAPSSRIYNGHAVSPSDFPWMARLCFLNGNILTLCGATMISTQYAVTAGHCVPESGSPDGYIILGGRSIDDVLNEGKPNVESFVGKGRTVNGRDIAVVKLKENVNVIPICLPNLDDTFADVKATMLGYGQTETGEGSNDLVAGDIDVPSNDQCSKGQVVFSSEMCGGNVGGEAAVCAGDSGGPLMYQNTKDNRWILIGIISGTVDCSSKTSYGLFTRVSSWVPWIQQNSNNAGCQVDANK